MTLNKKAPCLSARGFLNLTCWIRSGLFRSLLYFLGSVAYGFLRSINSLFGSFFHGFASFFGSFDSFFGSLFDSVASFFSSFLGCFRRVCGSVFCCLHRISGVFFHSLCCLFAACQGECSRYSGEDGELFEFGRHFHSLIELQVCPEG